MLEEKISKIIHKTGNFTPLFIFDPENELEPEVESLDRNNFYICKYTWNPLQIKLEFAAGIQDKVPLIYCPFKEPSTQDELKDFPLLDLLVAGKVIRLDELSDLLEELNWRPQHKNLVTKYKDELRYKYVSEIASRLDRDRFTEKSLQRALFAAWLGASDVKSEEWIIGKILVRAFDNLEEYNTFLNKIEKYHLQAFAMDLLRTIFPKEPEDLSPSGLTTLLEVMKYNCILLNVPGVHAEDPYSILKITDFTRAERLNNFREYLTFDPEFSAVFPRVFLSGAAKVREEIIFSKYGLKNPYYFKTPELIWLILREISKQWEKNPEQVLGELPELRKEIQIGSIADLASGYIYFSASVIAGINEIINIVLDKPEEYLESYASTWYKVDQDYRQAVHHFTLLNLEESAERIDFFSINARLNQRYNQFLNDLNKEWLNCWSSKSFAIDSGHVAMQSGFYEREIDGRDVKLAVIISDGLRYEVGRELLSGLHKDSRNMAEIRWQFASLPSVTAVGMANLLPGRERNFDPEN
ncbi:MAG: PglZ domain-containing protein, partial [Bacteroidales bacterium]|nr:PglZ domain-containing protein [Bacteroidales bacterium]